MKNYTLITIITTLLLYGKNSFSTAQSLDTTKIVEDDSTTVIHKEKDSLPSIKEKKENSPLAETEIDSAQVDSLKRVEARFRYLQNNRKLRHMYLKHPQNSDSLFNPSKIYPFGIFQTDGMHLSDIMHRHPLYVSAPVTLSSNMNRFLFYGQPAPHLSMHPGNSLFRFHTQPNAGVNLFSAAEMKTMQLKSPGTISFGLQPNNLTRPETSLLIEMGVFDESILNLRFARPITRSLQFGIFSNFQYFIRKIYDHNSGDLYNFYKSIYEGLGIDTTNVMHHGTNPLSREHVVATALSWTPQDSASLDVTYRYSDLHNDVVSQQTVVNGGVPLVTLARQERSHYSHHLSAQLQRFALSENLRVNGEAFLLKAVNRLSPIVRDSSVFRRGESFKSGGALAPYIGFKSFGGTDSLALLGKVYRSACSRFNKQRLVTHHTETHCSYTNRFIMGKIEGVFSGLGGAAFVKLNGELESFPLWKGFFSAKRGVATISLYGQQEVFPPHMPFDTILDSLYPITPGDYANAYQVIGCEALFRMKKAGLLMGAMYVNDLHEEVDRAVLRNWQDGRPPYDESQWVFTATPFFGAWKGLTGSSQWMISEKKPYFKSKSHLSYHLKRETKTLQLIFDLGLIYWSERDPIRYGDILTWNRKLFDVSFKTTAEIKSFRLFYKIDNLFNQRIAYVPGYYMPGLTFRWGFNWLIQG